ncbi:MAG: hypothetical protein HWE10_09910 [Gammaproteobacteria bacterium]|nr:hypothetical protein [Gammaproteobacteria bacterium]
MGRRPERPSQRQRERRLRLPLERGHRPRERRSGGQRGPSLRGSWGLDLRGKGEDRQGRLMRP